MSDKNDLEKYKEIEYVQRYQKELGEALKYVKGKQSMAELAAKCGVSPTTFSRIVNGTIAKPLERSLIERIAENSEGDKGYNFEWLMRANGMVPKDNSIRQQEAEKRSIENKRLQNQVKNTIMGMLFNSGLSTAPITGTDLEETDPYLKTSRYGFSRRVRFAIRINGAEPISWNFMTDIFTGNEYSEDQKEYEIDVKSQANWLLDDLKNVFLREIWEPEAFVGTKYSLVTINKDVYDALLQKLEGLTFENWFTLILVDIEQGTVIEEKQLPRKDGKEFESLFHKEDI